VIETIKGDVITALDNGDVDAIMHVVNCQGVMGSGVAKSIKLRKVSAFKRYLQRHKANLSNGKEELGYMSNAGGGYNLHAQQYYGSCSNTRFIDYGALAKSVSSAYCDMHLIARSDPDRDHDATPFLVGVPYTMRSDRAGGDWTIVCELLEGLLNPHMKVIAYKI
jgi:hypothetical protein